MTTDDSDGPELPIKFGPKLKFVGTTGQVEPIDEAVSNRRYWKTEGAVIDLDEQEKLAKAATEGPWTSDDGNIFSKPLSKKRQDAIIARMQDRSLPHPDAGSVDGSPLGFVASTGQDQPNFQNDEAHIAACSPDRVLAMVAALKVARRVTDLSNQLLDAINRGLNVAELGVERANAITDLKIAMKAFK